jgi:hypothetical protein
MYLGTAARHFSMGDHARQERSTMSAEPHDAGESMLGGWKKVPLPDDAPATAFLADPPTDLTGPSTGGFTVRAKSPHGDVGAEAKSPHGITRTGAVLLDDRPPSLGRPVPTGQRRPVVAVVDTVISAHAGLGSGGGSEPFWRLPDHDAADPWPAPQLSTGAPTDPDTALAAERVRGHGTFIAGIVRQVAPEARILSLPVMDDRGRAETSDVLATLGRLLRRVRHARTAAEPSLFVDVVNLSFGWYPGREGRVFPAEAYRNLLDDLAAEGVRVVASAGNRSTDVPVYPAAFAAEQKGSVRTPLVSVGALDPDGHVAPYSNTGTWVTLLAPGTGLVSTTPEVSGVLWPDPLVAEAADGPYPNPNHLARGFARWGGTSFAAAWVSAKIASHLLDEPHGAELVDLGLEATHLRAEAALAATVADLDAWTRCPHGS